MIAWLLRTVLNTVAEYQLVTHKNTFYGHRAYIERKDRS